MKIRMPCPKVKEHGRPLQHPRRPSQSRLFDLKDAGEELREKKEKKQVVK
jgi:hypothetical protein